MNRLKNVGFADSANLLAVSAELARVSVKAGLGGSGAQLVIYYRRRLSPGSNTQNVSLDSPCASNAASRSVIGESMVSQVS